MHPSELPESPEPAIPAIPVICDRCRATGMAGDPAFAAIPDILDFAPVPRRAHANGWTPQHQRAFIAALAITGSPKQAARAIDRHEFGAQQLRTAKGGRAFAAAWDAALDLARERETHRIHDNLAELADRREQELAAITLTPLEAESWRERAGGVHSDPPISGQLFDWSPAARPEWLPADYPDDYELGVEEAQLLQVRHEARRKLLAARRLLLAAIAKDPARRQAWELLCGPVDWDQARTFGDHPEPAPKVNIHDPGMQVMGANGFLADMIGGEDNRGLIKRRLLEFDESNEARAIDGGAGQ